MKSGINKKDPTAEILILQYFNKTLLLGHYHNIFEIDVEEQYRIDRNAGMERTSISKVRGDKKIHATALFYLRNTNFPSFD